jgi:hypothetical protein
MGNSGYAQVRFWEQSGFMKSAMGSKRSGIRILLIEDSAAARAPASERVARA